MKAKLENVASGLRFKTGSGVNINICSDNSRTSTSLLRRMKLFDDDAWQRLVDSYGDRIYYWSRRTGMPPHDAHDVTAEVFVAILRKVKNFQHQSQIGGFRKWIRVITKNKIRDYWRKRQQLADVIGGSSWQQNLGELPYENSQQQESSVHILQKKTKAIEWIEAVRSEVSLRDWAVLQRLVIDQRSAIDVAEEFNISVNVVYLVKSRLLKRLRRSAEKDVVPGSPKS